ncbi:hypothetical protein, partial [Microseira wollei]|uniref:hypothetical protein n=1 Tax=Microseira wollei TaxID=467598 RepID=UPI001CFCDC90
MLYGHGRCPIWTGAEIFPAGEPPKCCTGTADVPSGLGQKFSLLVNHPNAVGAGQMSHLDWGRMFPCRAPTGEPPKCCRGRADVPSGLGQNVSLPCPYWRTTQMLYGHGRCRIWTGAEIFPAGEPPKCCTGRADVASGLGQKFSLLVNHPNAVGARQMSHLDWGRMFPCRAPTGEPLVNHPNAVGARQMSHLDWGRMFPCRAPTGEPLVNHPNAVGAR